MLTAICLVLFIVVPLLCARYAAPDRDKFLVSQLFGVAAIVFLAVLLLIANSVPFAGVAGDDRVYFEVSQREFTTIGEWFDLSQFNDTHEQAGYPLLLAWIHQISGSSLFVSKSLNVFFFLMIAVIWFVIGKTIGGGRLAFVYACGVLLCTPLWYYWMFLLKDMVIVLLQSWLLLGVVLLLNKGYRVRGYWFVALSTIAIIPFRSVLALVNVAVLGLSTVLEPSTKRSISRLVSKVVVFGSVAIGVLVVGSQPDLLGDLGVVGSGRMLERGSVEQTLASREMARAEYANNPIKFTVLYLVGEVAAFNPKSWGGRNFLMTRAGSTVPWIYFGLPLFLAGVPYVIRKRRLNLGGVTVLDGRTEVIIPDRAYLLLFLGFVLLYMAVSWLSGDTTRWRMASFPPMIGIAGVAWLALGSRRRVTLLIVWGWLVSVLLLGYYVLVK
jgi:hypothetical protein